MSVPDSTRHDNTRKRIQLNRPNTTVLEGSELSTKRDYRVAAAALGYEASVLLRLACFPGRDSLAAGSDATVARELACRAAHYARLGTSTLLEVQ